ncbi:hypothetical protein E2C01_063541 [Portunus trituberculatus]|uniref:Uncharacterized protein n=1 Tax=Portunus trituberculatus TaxID=210409 RepID=A0A5B7HHW5_PORTR|nr:hypothetical protein [Portunus trituberculatus]
MCASQAGTPAGSGNDPPLVIGRWQPPAGSVTMHEKRSDTFAHSSTMRKRIGHRVSEKLLTKIDRKAAGDRRSLTLAQSRHTSLLGEL